MKFQNTGPCGTAAISILFALAMSGPTALAQEPDEADASEEIIVTDIKFVAQIVVESDNDNDVSLNAIPAQAESTTPILYLVPRVAGILRHVFSAIAMEFPPSEFPDRAQSFAIQSSPQAESTLSTVAGDAAQIDSLELTDPASGSENGETIRNFQQKMFRTDI